MSESLCIFFNVLTDMGYAIEAVDRSGTAQVIRVRGCSTSFASAVTASDVHEVCSTIFTRDTLVCLQKNLLIYAILLGADSAPGECESGR